MTGVPRLGSVSTKAGERATTLLNNTPMMDVHGIARMDDHVVALRRSVVEINKKQTSMRETHSNKLSSRMTDLR